MTDHEKQERELFHRICSECMVRYENFDESDDPDKAFAYYGLARIIFEKTWRAARAALERPVVSEEKLENLIEVIAEEVSIWQRGSRWTLGHHIKRALLSASIIRGE